MAFQASLHGFPDIAGMRSSISESRRSVAMPPLEEVKEDAKDDEKEALSNTLDSQRLEESKTSLKTQSDPKHEVVEPKQKDMKKSNSLQRGRRNSQPRDSTMSKHLEDESGEADPDPDRRTSLMMLFRNARSPKRRRSSMFQNMVSWVRSHIHILYVVWIVSEKLPLVTILTYSLKLRVPK